MKRFSTVKPRLKKKLLIKGMILGCLGVFLLIGMGTFANLEVLTIWGMPTFCTGILLIGYGLIPYRKLTRAETHPHKLLFEKDHLIFISNRGNRTVISYKEIDQISYIEKGNRYGIHLHLAEKQPLFLPYFLGDACLDKIMHAHKANKSF